ncbi:hypothetical protein [Flavivirga eckloniae]|uniref:Uncharacterized protein n=1 Tax=Flavivirga eckloniae TaxID=1803846 RepID=A0A2K9PSZ8_9FLAO|nr:hypothetical protein [Flavivirga eckloniae]AUP80186.1 hypothetical protein C1H87_16305 [Flavivirga eckloniae]
MKASKTFGLFFFTIGLAFTVIGYSSYAQGATLRFLLSGPVFVLAGLAMVIVPGTEYTNKDLRTKRIAANDVFLKAPLKAKIIWAVAGGIGFIISTAFRDLLASFFE